VASGKTVKAVFKTGKRRTAASRASVTAYTVVGGVEYYSTYSVKVAGLNCGRH
jgi:hypothetical protein